MTFFYDISIRDGVDFGYHSDNLHPSNGEGRVGNAGFDKNLPLQQIINIAMSMEQNPNIIIKAGPNAKWYIKKSSLETLDQKIENCQLWRNTTRSKMYILHR